METSSREMRIIRVFPRRTKATPIDDMAFIGDPPLFRPEAEECHVSVTFTWDIAEGKRLRDAWANWYPTLLGGPAFGMSGEFEPGRYLKPGYTITSRGCPHKCWFCYVPEREGKIAELEIKPGNIIQDNNLTACSLGHKERVFAMLRTQKQVEFAGGLEAARIDDWWVENLKTISLKQLFIAYDQEGQDRVVKRCLERLTSVGFPRRKLRCFVLSGYPDDTTEKAEKRCEYIWDCGGMPFMMLYRNDEGKEPGQEWKTLGRKWMRPAAMFAYQEKEL
jgi:hypothetical protein